MTFATGRAPHAGSRQLIILYCIMKSGKRVNLQSSYHKKIFVVRTEVEMVTDFICGAPKSSWTVTAARKLKYACSLDEKL